MLIKNSLPDVQSQTRKVNRSALDWVGMEGVALPLKVKLASGEEQEVLARADIFVDLTDPEARGIHMSRLFKGLERDFSKQTLKSARNLKTSLVELLKTHVGLSEGIRLALAFDLPLRRKALITENSGWRSYPIELEFEYREDMFVGEMRVTIVYSSTCPQSASLARVAWRDQFSADFAGKEMVSAEDVEEWLLAEEKTAATAHAQRSEADVRVLLNEDSEFLPIETIIDLTESTLGTPVQTAVKREDEQEFARLSAKNLMFAEDAARKVASSFNDKLADTKYRIEVRHLESLHAHDAVAVVSN